MTCRKKYTVKDMERAIHYGFWYATNSQNNGVDVPVGNKAQWLLWYEMASEKDRDNYMNNNLIP